MKYDLSVLAGIGQLVGIVADMTLHGEDATKAEQQVDRALIALIGATVEKILKGSTTMADKTTLQQLADSIVEARADVSAKTSAVTDAMTALANTQTALATAQANLAASRTADEGVVADLKAYVESLDAEGNEPAPAVPVPAPDAQQQASPVAEQPDPNAPVA